MNKKICILNFKGVNHLLKQCKMFKSKISANILGILVICLLKISIAYPQCSGATFSEHGCGYKSNLAEADALTKLLADVASACPDPQCTRHCNAPTYNTHRVNAGDYCAYFGLPWQSDATVTCTCDQVQHCDMRIDLYSSIISAGQELDFSVYIKHALPNTITTPLHFTIQDLYGNIIHSIETPEYTFEQGDELKLNKIIRIPSNLSPGLYILCFTIQGMSRIMGPAKSFVVKN